MNNHVKFLAGNCRNDHIRRGWWLIGKDNSPLHVYEPDRRGLPILLPVSSFPTPMPLIEAYNVNKWGELPNFGQISGKLSSSLRFFEW